MHLLIGCNCLHILCAIAPKLWLGPFLRPPLFYNVPSIPKNDNNNNNNKKKKKKKKKKKNKKKTMSIGIKCFHDFLPLFTEVCLWLT